MRNKLFFAVAATLMSTSVYAHDVTFEAMDNNGDKKISKDEFHGNAIGRSTYSDYDLNGDGSLTKEEFGETGYDEGLFDDWDANDDDELNHYEYHGGTFHYHDDNEDGYWQEDEWENAASDGVWDI